MEIPQAKNPSIERGYSNQKSQAKIRYIFFGGEGVKWKFQKLKSYLSKGGILVKIPKPKYADIGGSNENSTS